MEEKLVRKPGFHQNIDMLQGPIFKNLVLFALPIFVSSLFQQFYNTMDTAIVGNTLGTDSLAAIGSCSSVYDLLVNFCLGMGNGLSIVTARSFGARDKDLLKRSVASSLCIGLVSSFVLTAAAMFLIMPLLRLIHVPEDMISESYSYISVIIMGLFVMFAYNLFSGLLRAIGNSFMPLLFLILSSLLNIGLDLLFILVFGMGVRGAAIATVAAQGVSAVLCLLYILSKTKLLVPERKHFRPDVPLMLELAGQGYSMAFMNAIVGIGSVVLQSGINGLADKYIIVAHTGARKLFMFFCMPFSSMGQAISTFVSQNRGARQPGRIRQGMKAAYSFDVITALFISLFLFIFAPALIRLITGSGHKTVLDNGSLYLRIVGPNYAVLGVLLQTRNALQGIGKKLLPLISSIIECIGKILFVLFLIPAFQYLAVIFCEPVIWVVMTIQLLFTFWNAREIQV